MDVKLIITSDGSHSLINTELDETYHSRHGAIQESIHVFIRNGLRRWAMMHPGQPINLLEIGFGTGLNALLTAMECAEEEWKVNYTTIEAFPIDETLATSLNYAKLMFRNGAEEVFQDIHRSPWEVWNNLTPHFRIRKLKGRLEDIPLEDGAFNLVYFDAFAPSKQPEMWELPMLNKVFRAMSRDSILVTYCAKGQVKRDLKSLGLVVETLLGPPGKKEMVRANRVV